MKYGMKHLFIGLAVAALCGCKSTPDINIPDLPWDKDDKPAPVKPAPEPEIVIHPDHVNWYGRTNKGGHGLYKPWSYDNPAAPSLSRLWLLEQHIRPSHIKTVGVYDGDRRVRYCNWPTGIGALSGRLIDGSQRAPDNVSAHYHSNRVKIRYARIDAEGQELRVTGWDNNVIAVMKPIERNVRQGK